LEKEIKKNPNEKKFLKLQRFFDLTDKIKIITVKIKKKNKLLFEFLSCFAYSPPKFVVIVS
jgi:hypothetical protein